MHDSKLAREVCELYRSDSVAYQSASVIKSPQTNSDFQGWHQDAPDYLRISDFRLASALTYLCEIGPNSDGTSLVKGGHRKGLLDQRYIDVAGRPVRKRTLKGFDESGPLIMSLEFRPSDVLIFNPRVIRRANSNVTSESKIGLINAYRAASCNNLTQCSNFKANGIRIKRRHKAIGIQS